MNMIEELIHAVWKQEFANMVVISLLAFPFSLAVGVNVYPEGRSMLQSFIVCSRFSCS